MRKIETKAFQACFMRWVQSVSEATSGDVVAIDGKTLRRSHNHRDELPAIHMVSAWSSKNGLVLGQEKTAEKSNESRQCWAIAPSVENFPTFKKWANLKSLIIKKDTSRKASVKRKRFMAALEDDFREAIIRQII